MLDRDLANLYGSRRGCLIKQSEETSRVSEGLHVFYDREEIMDISQIVTSSGIKHAPNVFYVHGTGVAMLSSVLNNPHAIRVNTKDRLRGGNG